MEVIVEEEFRQGGKEFDEQTVNSAESYEIYCASCNETLPSRSAFCPYCGNATFKESIIFSKSTAEYYPNHPGFKPWKDKPLVPKRTFNIKNDTKQPWVPTMRQKARSKPKPKVKTIIPQSTTELDSPSESMSVSSSYSSYSLKEDGSIRSVSELSEGFPHKKPQLNSFNCTCRSLFPRRIFNS
jgi:predicted RNA-binding Zn-ribbon protein involved in translation (DUF1610 family)